MGTVHHAFMNFITKWASAKGVADHLYFVGGLVRNSLLNLSVKDYDVVVDSIPLGSDSSFIAGLLAVDFACSFTTNQYGVALCTFNGSTKGDSFFKGFVVELANARGETYGGVSGKGYKPDSISLADLQTDALRRDFRCNTGLYRFSDFDGEITAEKVIDITGYALSDINGKILVCPLGPNMTFQSDSTRMLRAIKFQQKLGFTISEETEKAIIENAAALKNAPYPAIADILINDVFPLGIPAVQELHRLGLLGVIAEMMGEDKSFRQTLIHWSMDKDLGLILEMVDLGLPIGYRFAFLNSDQLLRFREIKTDLSDPVGFLDILKQPGKVCDIPALMAEFGIKGPEVKSITHCARFLLLGHPSLSQSGLTEALRDIMSGDADCVPKGVFDAKA